MIFSHLIAWINELFFFKKKDNVLIGLSQLKEAKEPVSEIKAKKNREIKISDLIRGDNY